MDFFTYNSYFSMGYLIEYGYFDFKYAHRQVNEDYLLSNLLYKNVFTTEQLVACYEDLKESYKFFSTVDTIPVELSVYKNEDERRKYKLPNMYSYICLCKHLSDNRKTYKEILHSSDKSLSNEFYNNPFYIGKNKRENNRFGKKHIFKTDIQNFYPSIYTHSIPWLLVGKVEAKRTRTNQGKYYNQLDSLIQRCQRGETHGIPTGTFASRLIAEVYLCKLDEKLEKHSYVRYVDDYELSYNDEKEKGEFYKDLTKELNDINLNIKVEKNLIDTFPFRGDNNSWFFFDYFNSTNHHQKKRIYNFIDTSIYKEREGFKGSLKLMFKALKSSVEEGKISESDLLSKPLQQKIFNLVLMKPDLSVYYLEFVDTLSEVFIEETIIPSIDSIKLQIEKNINRYIEFNYHQELFSLLSIFYHLEIDGLCNRNQLLNIIEIMDDLSSVLSFEFYVNQEDGFDDTLFNTIEQKLSNSLSWIEEFWFFKYHVLLRINEKKDSDIRKKYKEYMYRTYGEGKEKSLFFNQDKFRKVESPINLMFQHDNTQNQEIRDFYNYLIEKKVCFLKNQ
ncbi:RNA-directed DNA polymerase [Brevibacillus laterosporus]|nr:RNA-directed DNA polymerase [Brevibacillus laterosporus]